MRKFKRRMGFVKFNTKLLKVWNKIDIYQEPEKVYVRFGLKTLEGWNGL